MSTAVRESVADIHSTTPVAQIISRGRAVRARRRIPGVAGALTVAAVTALAVTALAVTALAVTALAVTTLAVTTLLPAGHPGVSSGQPGNHPASVRLAAWTVAKQANGDIDVTINQLKDPAGLQAALRDDGLPVTVSFSGPMLSASCQGYAAIRSTLRTVAQFHSDYLAIDPSALPSGTGVAIFDEPGTGLGPHPSGTPPTHGGTPPTHPSVGGPLLTAINGPLAVGLVYASQQCTG